MIVKLLNSSSKNFGAVQYLENKTGEGKGELMLMKNFPSQINYASQRQEVKDYFKSISNNGNVDKPQFHAVISTENRNHNKEDLAELAEDFMKKMGYEKQPILIVFHNDTDHNHVHIVTTRVDKQNFKKIDDSFERYKAQTSLRLAISERWGIDHKAKVENLLSYSFSNQNQLSQLLKQSGYDSYAKDENLVITHNGAELLSYRNDKINFTQESFNERKKQLTAILYKLKDLGENKVFKVEDMKTGKIAFHSELQATLKNKFGIDIVFSNADNKTPFGYTLIDNKNKAVFKGSEIAKLNTIFNFVPDKIDKKLFELLTNCNKCDGNKSTALKTHLGNAFNTEIKDFMMVAKNPRITHSVFAEMRDLAINKIKNGATADDDKISFIKQNGEYFAYSEKDNKIVELEKLVGKDMLNEFTNAQGSADFLNSKEKDQVNTLQLPSLEELSKLTSLLNITGGFGGSEDNDQSHSRRKKKKR